MARNRAFERPETIAEREASKVFQSIDQKKGMIAWQKIEKTRAVLWGLTGAAGMLLVPGTTTLWRCALGICVVIASVAWDLNRK